MVFILGLTFAKRGLSFLCSFCLLEITVLRAWRPSRERDQRFFFHNPSLPFRPLEVPNSFAPIPSNQEPTMKLFLFCSAFVLLAANAKLLRQENELSSRETVTTGSPCVPCNGKATMADHIKEGSPCGVAIEGVKAKVQ